MRKAMEILSHACVILALMFLVFLVLDQFNPMMNFVNSKISQGLLVVLCLCTLSRSVLGWTVEKRESEKQ